MIKLFKCQLWSYKFNFQRFILRLNREVKPVRLDDDTERYSRSRIKTLNYASYTHLVRMVKILRSQ